MTMITSLGGAGHLPQLSAALDEVAGIASRAARAAGGDYLNVPSSLDFTRAVNDAGRAVTRLEDLGARIAVLDGGEDGLKLAATAREHLEAGKAAIRDGVMVEDDLLRDGGVIVDTGVTSAAATHFEAAEQATRGIAAIAKIEETSADDLLRALVGDA